MSKNSTNKTEYKTNTPKKKETKGNKKKSKNKTSNTTIVQQIFAQREI